MCLEKPTLSTSNFAMAVWSVSTAACSTVKPRASTVSASSCRRCAFSGACHSMACSVEAHACRLSKGLQVEDVQGVPLVHVMIEAGMLS